MIYLLVILAVFSLFAWSFWNSVIALNSGFTPSPQSLLFSLFGGGLYAAWMYVAASSRILKKRSLQLKPAIAYAFVGIASFAGVSFPEPLSKVQGP